MLISEFNSYRQFFDDYVRSRVDAVRRSGKARYLLDVDPNYNILEIVNNYAKNLAMHILGLLAQPLPHEVIWSDNPTSLFYTNDNAFFTHLSKKKRKEIKLGYFAAPVHIDITTNPDGFQQFNLSFINDDRYPDVKEYYAAKKVVDELENYTLPIAPAPLNFPNLQFLSSIQFNQRIIDFMVGHYGLRIDDVKNRIRDSLVGIIAGIDAMDAAGAVAHNIADNCAKLTQAFNTQLPDNFSAVYSIAVLQPGGIGSLATGHEDGNIMVWNVDSGSHVMTYNRGGVIGHTSAVNCLIAMNANTLISGGYGENRILTWRYDIYNRAHVQNIDHNTVGGHGAGAFIRSIVRHPNGNTFISGGTDRYIKVWNLNADGLFVNTYTLNYYNTPAFNPHIIGQSPNNQMPITLFNSNGNYYVVANLNTVNHTNRDIYFWGPLPAVLGALPVVNNNPPVITAAGHYRRTSVKSLVQITGTNFLASGCTVPGNYVLNIFLWRIDTDNNRASKIRSISSGHRENRIIVAEHALCQRLISPGNDLLVSSGGVTTRLWRINEARTGLVVQQTEHADHRVYDVVSCPAPPAAAPAVPPLDIVYGGEGGVRGEGLRLWRLHQIAGAPPAPGGPAYTTANVRNLAR